MKTYNTIEEKRIDERARKREIRDLEFEMKKIFSRPVINETMLQLYNSYERRWKKLNNQSN